VISIALQPLPESLLAAAVELDQAALGGLWTAENYRQELERSSSDLLGMWTLADGGALDNTLQDNELQVLASPGPLSQSAAHSQLVLLGVGCAWTILDESHLVLLAVHPRFRRQGLGCAILLGLLNDARNRGSNYATLEVRASNQAAIALYEKLGFKTAGRRPRYYSDVSSSISEDALILWCSGLQSAEFKVESMQRWQSLEQRWEVHGWEIASPFGNALK
jgi:[ribosomal protein S18]-alanine N-acetyltransferase